MGWTVLVWSTRINNILADDQGAGALLVAVGLTGLAVAAAADLVTHRLAWAVPALAGATVVVWAVRAPLVLVHDHPGGFKAVHLVLAAVSIGLAVLSICVPQRSRAALSGGQTGRRRGRGSGSAPRPRP